MGQYSNNTVFDLLKILLSLIIYWNLLYCTQQHLDRWMGDTWQVLFDEKCFRLSNEINTQSLKNECIMNPAD